MERLFKPSRVSEILKKYGFRFSKALGQNFLIDGNIVAKIVDAAEITKDDYVLEIGPGIGTLTEELSLRAKKVLSVEIDNRLKPMLQETILDQYDNVVIHYEDILKSDLKDLIKENFGDNKFKVVANLPYYVTTPIITRLIEDELNLESITIMIQKEVANRFAAKPSTKDYGSLSVFIQFYSEVFYNFTVPSTVFMPKPNVDSAVVTLKIKDELPNINREKFFKVVKAGFSKRRKTIVNALSTYGFDTTKDEIKEALAVSNIDEKRRAETLSSEEFIVLSINFPEI